MFLKKFALCAPTALWQIRDMSTLTVELPDDLAARLAAASEQTHVPPAQLVRTALEKALPPPAPDWPADGPSLHERMKDFIGCIDSGVTDLATNPKYLEGLNRVASKKQIPISNTDFKIALRLASNQRLTLKTGRLRLAA
jgi:Ribbon-helix-helix domain